MGKGRINLEALLKVIVLAGFATFFFILLQTDSVQLFVHPRMIPFIKFAIGAFLLIVLVLAGDLFKARNNERFMSGLVMLIPMLMAFAIPAASMDSRAISSNTVNVSRQAADGTILSASKNIKESEDQSAIRIHETSFVRWMDELYNQPELYIGRTVEFTGFVFKDSGIEPDEFLAARFMMSCCTADVQVAGLYCRYENIRSIKNDTWLRVTGTLQQVERNGEKLPVVEVERVEQVEKPKNEYIYTY